MLSIYKTLPFYHTIFLDFDISDIHVFLKYYLWLFYL